MPNERLSKKVFYEELQEGNRSQGGQKRYKDTIKASLKNFNVTTVSGKQNAQDQTKWHCLTNKRVAQFEAKKICEAERYHKKRKERANGSSSDLETNNQCETR